MATQTCDRTVTGNNFDYGSALSIIQDEEYLENEDFDDIRLIRRQFEEIQGINRLRGRKFDLKQLYNKHQKQEVQSLETGLCYGYSHSG